MPASGMTRLLDAQTRIARSVASAMVGPENGPWGLGALSTLNDDRSRHPLRQIRFTVTFMDHMLG